MRHVLVVENDPSIRQMLYMMLDLEGYAVRTASGAAVLDLLRESGEPHVVLVNHLMPDIDGPSVLAAAAEDDALARHRYVLMSSCPACHPAPRVSLPYRLLAKPFTIEQLLDAVEDAAGGLASTVTSLAVSAAAPAYAQNEAEGAAVRVPLLLTFSPRSAMTAHRWQVVVRTQPGALVAIAVRSGAERDRARPEVRAIQVADADGYCSWRWPQRTRCGHLRVEARAEWCGQQVSLARSFSVNQR